MAAKEAGFPRDQFDNLLRSEVVLQPRQLLASAVARQCDQEDGPTDVGYGGARGGGKSHWLIVQMAVDDCQRYPGLKCLLLRKVGKAGTESFEDLKAKILANIPHKWNASRNILTFPNNSRIVLGNYQNAKDVEKYIGIEYDVIGIEEATTLLWDKVKMIRSCNRTSKPGWRPRVYYTTNPGGVGHGWFHQMFIKAKDATVRFVQATVRDNKFVNSGYVKILEGLTGWQREAWLNGNWDIAAGQFFSTWDERTHVIAPLRGFRPVKVWGALDYGFTHPTAFYLFGKDGDGNVYVMAEHVMQKKLPAFHAKEIERLLQRFGLEPKHLKVIRAGADCFMSRGDEKGLTIAEQYAGHGIQLEQANTDRIAGAAEMLARLGDPKGDPAIPARFFIFNTCARLIACLPFLVHDPSRPEDVLKVDADEDGNNGDDEYDACRYGLMEDFQAPKVNSGGAYRPPPTNTGTYVPR
jgi:hypothetical protein